MCVHIFGRGEKMTNNITISAPAKLRARARFLGINISQTCRDAIAAEVSKVEKEARKNVAKQNPGPATTDVSLRGDVHG